VRRRLSPGRLVLAALVLSGVAFGVLWLAPSDEYLFLPDRAHPVAPHVTAKGEKPDRDGGGIYFVDVIVRRATILESLFPGLRGGSTLVPAHAVNPPGVSEEERRRGDRRLMEVSQQVAAAVALRELGYRVTARPAGAMVSDVSPGAPAAGKLRPTDVVVAVDGRPVRAPADLQRLVRLRRPGESVRLTVRGPGGLRTVVLRTVADPDEPGRPIIGVYVEPDVRIRLPFPVRIDIGDIGGPSAGLAFALDLMEELGRDVDRGYRVAATGELELDGRVSPVGGLKQKTIGARRTRVDIFLVPAGENAREARRYAGDLRVVAVQSFRQALRALATLPPKT
jgi:PDZ domain-containing protein